MSRAVDLINKILNEAYSAPIPQFVGTQNNDHLVPNPNDVKGQSNDMDIEDNVPLAAKIGNIIDSLSDDDITDDLADIVEKYLEDVDQSGDMTVGDAALMLPLEDCQDLYEELTGYLDQNNISYSEDDADSAGMPTSIPADLYPSSSGMTMGGNGVAPNSMTIGN